MSFLLTLSICAVCISAETASQATRIEDLVEHLGPSTTVQQVKLLRKEPRRAVDLLMSNLVPISEERIASGSEESHSHAMRVIWSIRALRYLTRQEFRARTSHAFGNSDYEQTRKDLLTLHGKKTVSFFAEWMSRGSIYVAPKDAQQEIIRQWRAWHVTHGKKWQLGPEPDLNDWYF